MPAPNKDLLAQLAKMNFIARMNFLPMDWMSPGFQFPDAFDAADLAVAPNPPDNLFREASLNKYHVDAAGDIGKKFSKYIDGVCDAICKAVDKWMQMATIAGPIITGPVGLMLPGNLLGPPIGPFIYADSPQKTAQEKKYSNAISQALGANWQIWQLGVMGTLMYPPFAAFPGPMAPPTPNTPLPLIAYPSAGESMLSPTTLSATMQAFLADPEALHHVDLFDSIAEAFYVEFTKFKATTMVTNVLGTGPVPIWAPPFVPVGPVIGGTTVPKPGILS